MLSDIGICTCDLTSGGCDVNCCCDNDCSDADRNAFSACDDNVPECVVYLLHHPKSDSQAVANEQNDMIILLTGLDIKILISYVIMHVNDYGLSCTMYIVQTSLDINT